jgi:uncharacterized membrane protein/mono/diheme cytochrome c family protein
MPIVQSTIIAIAIMSFLAASSPAQENRKTTNSQTQASHARAAAVHQIFMAKCVQCHGPQLAKPKGKFGYVLDLARLSANPDLLVPSKPDESRLWEMINNDEMPPEEAKAGPLTHEEKAAIQSWIAAGAPAPEAADASANSTVSEGTIGDPPVASFPKRVLSWLGRFHILTVHFPIALILAAMAGEAWFWWLGSTRPSPAVRFCILLGAPSAIAAIILGWLHAWAGFGASSPEALFLHRWIGTLAGIWLIAILYWSEKDSQVGRRTNVFRALLLIGCLLIGLSGHLGGTLVHGKDFFDF